MFSRLRDHLNRLVAEALPVRLAEAAAKRVLAHAALTQFRKSKVADIGALEALDHWHESMLPARVAKGLKRLRATAPSSPPLWQAVGESLRPRELAAGEVLAEGQVVGVERLEAVRVVSELKQGAGQGA